MWVLELVCNYKGLLCDVYEIVDWVLNWCWLICLVRMLVRFCLIGRCYYCWYGRLCKDVIVDLNFCWCSDIVLIFGWCWVLMLGLVGFIYFMGYLNFGLFMLIGLLYGSVKLICCFLLLLIWSKDMCWVCVFIYVLSWWLVVLRLGICIFWWWWGRWLW